MTQEDEFKIFDGMNKVNIEMSEQIYKNAPICHFKKMVYEESDSTDGCVTYWWECSVCGHTKDVTKNK